MLLETWLSSGFLSAAMGVYGLHLYKRFINGEGIDTLESPEEAICLTATERAWSSPFYINSGPSGSLSVPVGGGFYDSDKILLERTKLTTKIVYGDNQDIRNPYKKTWYLNTPDDLKAFTEQKGIELTSFPVTLPIRVSMVKYPLAGSQVPARIYHSPTTAIIGSNQSRVAKSSVLQKTVGTRTGAVVAGVFTVSSFCMFADWDQQHYKLKQWKQKLFS
jgi:hypothetical protein